MNLRPAGEKILKAGRYIHLLVCDTWEYVRRANCSGIVIILAVTEDQRIVFVEQYRVPVRGAVIELPAGLVNDRPGQKTETLAAAAKRELWEETGYRAGRMVKLTEGPAASGSSSDIIVFFKAEGLRKTGQGGGDASETIIVHEIPLPEVTSWLAKKRRQGLHIDPKIYTGLYFLNPYNNPH
ncbi:MAG TPA: NUDIX hydrolase [Candidatus Omnitrophota bacterium]|nr:NUDIX hydrolase [Candidatus Omnitrophota bacterium]HPN57223.1 NUDIX hydrolase [Candidatus Omnitrophota bacterium]